MLMAEQGMDQQAQHQMDEIRQKEIVAILKSIDIGIWEHKDILYLASELGVSEFFN